MAALHVNSSLQLTLQSRNKLQFASTLHGFHASFVNSWFVEGGSCKFGYGLMLEEGVANGIRFQPLSRHRGRRRRTEAFGMWESVGEEGGEYSMRLRSQGGECNFDTDDRQRESEGFRVGFGFEEGREVDVERADRSSCGGISDQGRPDGPGTQETASQDQRGDMERGGADARRSWEQDTDRGSRDGMHSGRREVKEFENEQMTLYEYKNSQNEGRNYTASARGSRRNEFVRLKEGGSGRSSTGLCKEIKQDNNSGVELPLHINVITSVANVYVKHLVKLRQSASYRNAAGCVVVVGSVPLREVCAIIAKENPTVRKPVKVLLVLEDSTPLSDLRLWSERVVFVSEPVMRKVAGVDSAQGLQGVGLLALPTSFCNLDAIGDLSASWAPSSRRVLALDGVQDPGNLGTLLRTAAAFAWDGVFLLPGCCDPFNEKALRASRGAPFRLPLATGRWPQLQSFAKLHQLKLYAADPDQELPNPKDGNELEEQKAITGIETSDTFTQVPKINPALVEVRNFRKSTVKREKAHGNEGSMNWEVGADKEDSMATVAEEEALCLVLGSEGQGLSEIARQSCHRVSIHMPGEFESLNVAVAGGILLYFLKSKTSLLSLSR